MQWVSCASSRLTVWLQGLKVRDLSSAPVSRAILETSCSGMRLQTCRKRLNRQRVGLIVFLFFIPAVWQVQTSSQHFFHFLWDGCATRYFRWICFAGTFYQNKKRNKLWKAPDTKSGSRRTIPPYFSLTIKLGCSLASGTSR